MIEACDLSIEQELNECMEIFKTLPLELQTEVLRDEFSQMSLEECRQYVKQVTESQQANSH